MSMISHPVISIFNDAASDRISCSGPTRIGLMSPTSDARTAPSSEALIAGIDDSGPDWF